MNNDYIEGRISHLEEDKGWGFITSDEKKFIRIFFHWSALVQNTKTFPELVKGDKVRFVPLELQQGWRAIKLEVI